MFNAIQYLRMAADDYRRMSKPNNHTITEYQAKKNADLAHEFEVAAAALLKLHNEGFNEGVLAGLRSLGESCKARRDKAAPKPENKHD